MLWIGTSGWQYRDWRGRFYPDDLPQHRWLSHYAAAFRTVELNNSFYRLPDGDTFAAWRSDTPADFVIATKASRFLSHMKRLKDPEEPIARLLARARRLGDKLGPVLVQLPAQMACDPEWLEHVTEVAARRAPAFLEMGLAHGWKGYYEVTPDHNGLVGEAADPERLFYATGFSGHGFMQAPAVGEIVRDLVLDREPFVDVSPLAVERFVENAPRPEHNVI